MAYNIGYALSAMHYQHVNINCTSGIYLGGIELRTPAKHIPIGNLCFMVVVQRPFPKLLFQAMLKKY